jgi:hypothetical protein
MTDWRIESQGLSKHLTRMVENEEGCCSKTQSQADPELFPMLPNAVGWL